MISKLIMEAEFVPYEQALALKELGFDEPCSASWTYKTKQRIPTLYGCGALLFDTDGLITNQTEDVTCSAPLYQQVFRWFREKYNLHSTIALISNSDTERRYMVMIDYIYPHKAIMEFEEYETHEEAEIECIKKLIKIIKNKQL